MMNSTSFVDTPQDTMKRRWQENHHHHQAAAAAAAAAYNNHQQPGFYATLVSGATPAAAAYNNHQQPGFYATLVSGATQHHHHPLSGGGGNKNSNCSNNQLLFHSFLGAGMEDDKLVSTVVPQITVVLEGRSICQRISLDKHLSYQSLAKALRQMFVDAGVVIGDNHHVSIESNKNKNDDQGVGVVLDLSNAIPGHIVAYEDLEDDLLLAGDLNWKDFVRVAKRIRIIPVKANSRKPRTCGVP